MPSDPRINRTKQFLTHALIELLKEKNIHTVTVKELCARAGVSRTAFYTHYLDMPDFLDKKIDETIMGLLKVNTQELFFEREAMIYIYDKLFQYVRDNSEILVLMMGENGLPELRQKVTNRGVEWYEKAFQPHRQTLPSFAA